MPKQIEKTEISQGPRDQNLWIYAGWLDIANAAENWDTLLTLTKLYALFYERIVVFDGYFHCNGPLFTALKRAASAGSNPTRRWTEEFLQEHEILKLLFEGIVVPAHRDGPSMADTFANGRRGIAPGEFMSVEKKVGQAVLEMVDELARYYYIQPKISAGKFHEALWDSLTDDQTLIGQVLSHPQVVEKDGFLQRDIAIRVCCILDDFHDQLTIAKGQSDFRRGWVEKWAAKEAKDRPARVRS